MPFTNARRGRTCVRAVKSGQDCSGHLPIRAAWAIDRTKTVQGLRTARIAIRSFSAISSDTYARSGGG
eukprot:926265-Pyramimonas_sp.AAC.1